MEYNPSWNFWVDDLGANADQMVKCSIQNSTVTMFNNPQRAQYAGFGSIVQIDPWIAQVMGSCTEHKQP